MQNKNIILNQYNEDIIKEVYPKFNDTSIMFLSLDSSLNVVWENPLKKISLNNNVFLDSSIFINNSRFGINRKPLYNYILDIGIPKNSVETALHIGDGSCGFSFGNGTDNGFIPEIIGMGLDENDPGLYLLGRCGNSLTSEVPLVVIEGLGYGNSILKNRPIFGISCGIRNNNYAFSVDAYGRIGIGKVAKIYNMEIDGILSANDIVINIDDTSVLISTLINRINSLEKQIKELKEK